MLNQCTEDFHCLVINNNAKSNKLEDQVFWYKATSHKNFKLCASRFWKYNKDGNDSSDDDFDLNKVRRKSTPKVNVIYKTY